MTSKSKSNNGKIILLIVLVVILFTFIGLALAGSNHSQATQNTQTSTQTSALQDCINRAHGAYDGLVASEEGFIPPSHHAQSLLDQSIAGCHQQYGY